jgi:signal transduction histidine kinase
MLRVNSLALRLILTSSAISVVMLAVAALLLGQLFSAALERNFDARLRAVLDGLLSDAQLDANGAPQLSQQLSDTRFGLPLSGWYWQIEPPAKSSLPDLASASLLEQRLAPAPDMLANRDAEGIASFYMFDSNNTKLRVIEEELQLPGSDKTYAVTVAGNFDELRSEVQSFRQTMFLVLGLLGVGLVVSVVAQVIFGLRPLRQVQRKLTAIREGKVEKLEGDFPAEIQPVADELNLLIQSNAEVIERARTQVGNLAHALKTPLSVLTNEAGAHQGQLSDKVKEQTRVMRDQVSLYLDRARRAARAQSLGAVTEVKPVLDGLGRTLERIYRDKGLSIAVACDPALKFRGEKQDLEEMAGNLMDNACQWAAGRIEVSAELARDLTSVSRLWFYLRVDDDGPGLPPDKRAEALKRGGRLDESKPGSGLGLNIVKETVSMYSGKLELADATIGGLRVQLRLPATG